MWWSLIVQLALWLLSQLLNRQSAGKKLSRKEAEQLSKFLAVAGEVSTIAETAFGVFADGEYQLADMKRDAEKTRL